MRRLVHRISLVVFLLLLAGGAATAFTASNSMSPTAAGMVTVRVPPPSTLLRVGAGASGAIRQQSVTAPHVQQPAQENYGSTTVTTGARACNGLVSEEARTEFAGSLRVATTTNYRNVEGLMLSVVQDEYGTFTDFSIPQWLWDAYGGNYRAIVGEIHSGRLANRRSPQTTAGTACGNTVAVPAVPSAPARPSCDGPEPVISRTGEGAMMTVTETNYRRVEGLVQETTFHEGLNTTSYGVPGWLFSAYGGNYAAIVQEIESGRLSNRRAAPCPN